MSDLIQQNYADRMFELEAILDHQSTLQAITQLNDHYRVGIDYYSEKQPRKATHLHKKMTSILANPDNIRILERQSKKHVNGENGKLNKKTNQPVLNNRKLTQQVTKFHTVAQSCIQNMVEKSNKNVNKVQNLKKRDLNKQQQNLKDRIMMKRVKSQQKFRMKSETCIPSQVQPSHLKNGLNRLIE